MSVSLQTILRQHTGLLLRHAADIYALRSILCDMSKAGGGDPALIDEMIRKKADKLYEKAILEIGDTSPEFARDIALSGLISRLDKEL